MDLCRLRRTPWLPIVVDLEAMSKYRRDRVGGPIRVSHAPTNRDLKSTELILDILYTMPDIEVEFIEHVPWAECLERKSRSDIYVDELTLGYGMNAIECWAMGIPVVSGITDRMFRTDALAHWGALPFVEASAESLRGVISALVASPQLRYQAAERGREFVQHYHSPEAVVDKVIQFVTRARGVWLRENRRPALTRRSTLSYETNSAEGR